VNAVEAELTMRLAAPAELREAARPTLVELLRRVDSRAYTALLAERGLLTLLGSRAIELAPEAVDDVVRSGVESARREARLRALMLGPGCVRRARRHRGAQPGPAQIDRRGARVPAALRRRPRRPRADRRPGRTKRCAPSPSPIRS
jgi:hypothetical protein